MALQDVHYWTLTVRRRTMSLVELREVKGQGGAVSGGAMDRFI